MEDTLDGLPTIHGDDSRESKLLANRYIVIRKLGEGGMGMVYLAEDTELGNNKVAIKFIPPMLAGNVRAIKNLKKEAQTAMQLSHPNIVRLHDLHTDGHQKFLVMEYIEGKTLEEILAEKDNDKLTLEELLPIAKHIAAGLDYAHSKNVLHRDLKPSNIMIGKSGTIRLLDFGIAREMKDSFTRVTGQETSGTLPYMSPEQLMGENPSPSMDIYSFGAVLYECLSGHPPFYRGDIRRQIEAKEPPNVGDVPEYVNKALQATLAKKASNRPATAKELILWLGKEQAAAGKVDEMLLDVKAPREAPDSMVVVEKIRKWVKIHKAQWKEGEWKDFVISLYDDGCAVGMSRSKLERIRDSKKKIWIKAEKIRTAENRRRAAKEAERKRKEAEEAHRESKEGRLFEEIKTAPTIQLCERYLSEFPNGRYVRKVKKTNEGLRNERKGQFSLVKIIAVLALVLVMAGYIGISSLQPKESPTRKSPEQNKKQSRQTVRSSPRSVYRTPASTTSSVSRQPKQGDIVTNSIGIKLVYIPAGEFMMGSSRSAAELAREYDTKEEYFANELPQHTVRISRGFWMGQTEVTQSQWQAIMGTSVSQQIAKAEKDNNFKVETFVRGLGSNYPMCLINWDEAAEFCKKLSQKESRAYRLPTEAEWEYACRAGSGLRYSFGGNDNMLYQYAWYTRPTMPRGMLFTSKPVGQKKPNAFGLYDMYGNMWEWCSDWYDEKYYSKSPSSDPTGPTTGRNRVLRGASWESWLMYCRSAERFNMPPVMRFHDTGFRIVVQDSWK